LECCLTALSIAEFNITTVIDERMTEGYYWYDTNSDKPVYLKKTLSHCHLVYHKSDKMWPGVEIGSPQG
jgi:hypothetical protein